MQIGDPKLKMLSQLFLIVFFSNPLLQAPPSQGVLVDKIVAIVNETDLITWSQVREMMTSKTLRALLNPHIPKEEEILQYLIENTLILQEIGDLSYHNTNPVDLEIAGKWIMKKYGQDNSFPTEKEFDAILEQKGLSREELKKLLEPQFRGIEYIRRKNRFTLDVQDSEKVFQLFEDWLKELNKKAVIQYPEL